MGLEWFCGLACLQTTDFVKWASSGKSLPSGVNNQVKLKLACSATEIVQSLDILDLASRGIVLSKQQTITRWSDCADAQADLYLCCSHVHETGFLMHWVLQCMCCLKRPERAVCLIRVNNDLPFLLYLYLISSQSLNLEGGCNNTFPPLPSGNPQTPFLSILWCYLPISSSFSLSFHCSPQIVYAMPEDLEI